MRDSCRAGGCRCYGRGYRGSIHGAVSENHAVSFPRLVCKANLLGLAMAKTRRYSIEVKDSKSKALLVSTAANWTEDEKHVAVAQIFRLAGRADGKRPRPSRPKTIPMPSSGRRKAGS
jgi:hypothetical protein